MKLPAEAQRIVNQELTYLERVALDYELGGFGLRRTAAVMDMPISSVRFYRLSAWAKIGKHLVAEELRAA